MLNMRFRERTNSWPGFVDLFSNLVIILIFLLIVFVFLWTTTSVFNKASGLKIISNLKKTNAEQTQTIAQMSADEQESRRLLMLARDGLDSMNAERVALEEKISNLTDANVLVSQESAREIESLKALAEQTRKQLENALGARDNEIASIKSQSDGMVAELNYLNSELEKLNNALMAAEAIAAEQQVKYTEMSNRLNKALADKVAELNAVSQYQSEFYRAIRTALGTDTEIVADGDRFIVPSDILFASGRYNLTDAGKKQLAIIAKIIMELENKIPNDVAWIIVVDGHTDIKPVVRGNRGYSNNTQLSLLRAMAVVAELERAGVAKMRLIPAGYGEMYPVALGTDAASLQKNRRIELRLTNR